MEGMAGDTGAPGFIPLYDDNTSFAPIQDPFNGISAAVNAALKASSFTTYPDLATLNLPANAGTTVGQHATVNADPTAYKNGDYAWSGSAWVATGTPGTSRVVPISAAGGTISGSTVNFASATAVSLNTCFSAAFDNYHVELVASGASATQLPTMTLRSGGVDSSAANYDYTLQYSLGTPQATALLARTSFQLGAANPMTNFKASIDLSSPFLAAMTTITAQSTGYASGTSPLLGVLSGGHRVTASFDGMTIGFSAAMSGTIRVYGWSS